MKILKEAIIKELLKISDNVEEQGEYNEKQLGVVCNLAKAFYYLCEVEKNCIPEGNGITEIIVERKKMF